MVRVFALQAFSLKRSKSDKHDLIAEKTIQQYIFQSNKCIIPVVHKAVMYLRFMGNSL